MKTGLCSTVLYNLQKNTEQEVIIYAPTPLRGKRENENYLPYPHRHKKKLPLSPSLSQPKLSPRCSRTN